MYHLYAVLFQVSSIRIKRLIGNEYTLVRILPGCCSDQPLENVVRNEKKEMCVQGTTSSMIVPLNNSVCGPAVSVQRDLSMTVPHEAIDVVVETNQKCALKGFCSKDQRSDGVEARTATDIVVL